jgi:nucleoside-diphosphate-sugar epimerase
MLLITGATGHSGKWLLLELSKAAYVGKVRCLVRSKKKADFVKDLNLDIELIEGSLDSEEDLIKALENVEKVIHIVSIRYSRKIVELGLKRGVNWFILVHTTGRFSKFKMASSRYIETEDGIIRDFGDKVTILRPTMIYGSSEDKNMWKLIKFLSKNKFFPVFGSGKNLMQPVHASCLGKAYFDVLMNESITKGKQYDLSGKNEIRYLDILKTVQRGLGSNNTFIFIPMWLSVFAARVYNFIFGSKAVVSVEQVLRLNEDKVFNHYQAVKDFGYAPKTFEEGIGLELEEFKHKTPKGALAQITKF